MISVRKLRLTDPAPSGLSATTAESRKRMTVPELIAAMGKLHVNHPAFLQRPRSLLPMQNLAGKQPVMQGYDAGLLAGFRALLVWVLR